MSSRTPWILLVLVEGIKLPLLLSINRSPSRPLSPTPAASLPSAITSLIFPDFRPSENDTLLVMLRLPSKPGIWVRAVWNPVRFLIPGVSEFGFRRAERIGLEGPDRSGVRIAGAEEAW